MARVHGEGVSSIVKLAKVRRMYICPSSLDQITGYMRTVRLSALCAHGDTLYTGKAPSRSSPGSFPICLSVGHRPQSPVLIAVECNEGVNLT